MRLRETLVASGFCFLSVLSGIAEATTISIAKYTNYALGNRWVYNQSILPGLWSVVVDSHTVRNGIDVVLLQEYDSDGRKNDQDFLTNDVQNELRLVGGLNDFGQPTEEVFFYDSPIVRMLKSFEVGEVYSETTKRTDIPGASIEHKIVFTFETVSVPFGTFVDALHVSESFFSEEFGTRQQELWYACGMGLVKRIHDDSNVWQLERFSGTTADCREIPTPVSAVNTLALLISTFPVIVLATVRSSLRGKKSIHSQWDICNVWRIALSDAV
jgi:hypothetical protein